MIDQDGDLYFPELAIAAKRLDLDAYALAEAVLSALDAGFTEREAVTMSIIETLQRRGAYHGRLKQMVDDGTVFRMEENGVPIPESAWEGSFRLFGVDVHCHVLSDGRRIIEADSMNALLEAMANGIKAEPGDVEAFARWQRGEVEKGGDK